MANKRDLKKNIKFICGEIAGECLFSETFIGINEQEVAQIVVNLAELQEETIEKVSFSYDKTSKEFDNYKEFKKAKRKYNKTAYSTLKEQFNAGLQTAVKDLNAIMPK